ncbi:MAG: hypothetical protein JWN44_851 [Myxococcales bacterium]|nr:hypothetical protein [Myxococcales bacterium]
MGAVRIGFVLFTLGLMSVPAAAEDKVAARKAFLEGSKYFDLNQYAEALEAFKRAYWNFEDPVILYNVAQCHRALKHKSEAIEFYRSYLRKRPDARNREDVQKIIADLTSAIEKEKAISDAPPLGPMPTDSRLTAAPVAPDNAQATPVAVSTSAPTRSDKPVYQRGWFWGVIGGVVAVGVGVGVGVGLGTRSNPPKAADGAVTF